MNIKKIKYYFVIIRDTRNYITFTKIFNLLISKLEYKQGKIELKSFPHQYFIDISNHCNLRCSLCPTSDTHKKRKKQFMSFENYKKIFDKIKRYPFYVHLYNWGEPFLNNDIIKIIEYTKKNKVGVVISTNFNTVNDEIIESLVRLKVDTIFMSIDGGDQETYSSYRRTGDFNRAISNMKKLVLKKKELDSKYPIILWQYLVNKKNEKTLDKAKQMAEEIGVKMILPKFQISQEIVFKNKPIDKKLVEEWICDNLKDNIDNYSFRIKGPCAYLYQFMVINPEGTTSPCCAIYDSKTDFGDILNNDLKDVWNNSNYLSARSIFYKKRYKQQKRPYVMIV
jgi:MoaA/NifB/PqqE/SkfB family radical SAM enzyme